MFKAIAIMSITTFFNYGMSTFFVLFALEYLNPAELGILIGMQFLTQSLFDYPTGALGDWIGQKWVIITAYLFLGSGYIIYSISTTFSYFLLAFILLGIGASQLSGTFMTWFDNNYKIYAYEDTKRTTYSFIFSRFMLLDELITGSSIISVGIFVEFTSRELGFFILGLIYFLSIFLVFIVVIDHPDYKRPEQKKNEYIKLLAEGLRIGWKNTTLRYILIGTVITQGTLMIWASLILFPMYQTYAKTDIIISATRAIIFVYMAIAMIFLGYIVKRIHDTQRWLGISTILTYPVFYLMFFFFLQIFPAQESFSLVLWLLLLVAFSSVNTLGSFTQILTPKFYLDLIPDKNRNSIYSLIPTLITICNIFTVSIGGIFITTIGVVDTIFILFFVAFFSGLISGIAIMKYQPLPKLEDELILEKTGEEVIS
ncbi:MAG: MFS transporter [Candidatus Thorarchaeota archaeon]